MVATSITGGFWLTALRATRRDAHNAAASHRVDARVGHGVWPAPFDRLALDYDERFTKTALGRWLRQRVWDLVAETLRPGGTVLELNGGTGEDACWLAQRGMHVTCTDAAPRMIEVAARKVARRGLQARVNLELLDLNRPLAQSRLTGPYDTVLSNFGGLNCVLDRRALAAWLARRTTPGAGVVLVVMGPFCPWEMVAFAVTRPQLCLRRWRHDGVAFAHDGDGVPRVRYPSPAQLGREFAPWFERTRLTGLGVLLPPTPWQSLLTRHPRLFAVLGRIERAVAGRWPATWLNDHYVLELRRRG